MQKWLKSVLIANAAGAVAILVLLGFQIILIMNTVGPGTTPVDRLAYVSSEVGIISVFVAFASIFLTGIIAVASERTAAANKTMATANVQLVEINKQLHDLQERQESG